MYSVSKKYGLVKSRAYRKWIERNLPVIKESLDKVEFFPIEVVVKVVEGYGFHKKADIDNCLKAILDIFVSANIIPDDNHEYVTKVEAEFMPFWSSRRSEAITYISYFEPNSF